MAALDQYERPLTRYALRLLSGDDAAARDVVQHAFLKLCEQDYQSIDNRVAPWLYTVCRNRAIDTIRGRSHEEQLDLSKSIQPSQNGHAHKTENDPARIVEEADFFEQIRRLINDLPESQREVVELWSQGFSSHEVGEIVGKRSGTVRIALHRAIKQLRRHESVKRWLGEIDEADMIPSPLSTPFREPR